MYENINTSIERHGTKFNKYLKNLLYSNLSKNKLSKAMLYGTFNGGKRIRPYLISTFGEIVNLPKNNYYQKNGKQNDSYLTICNVFTCIY